MPALVTSLYAALLGMLCIVLSGMVGQARGKFNVPLGDSGKPDIILANRRHMNFVENVPLALILIGFAELNGASSIWIHCLGGTLLLARLIHPFGLSIEKIMVPARIIGAGLTVLVQLAASITLLWQHFAFR